MIFASRALANSELVLKTNVPSDTATLPTFDKIPSDNLIHTAINNEQPNEINNKDMLSESSLLINKDKSINSIISNMSVVSNKSNISLASQTNSDVLSSEIPDSNNFTSTVASAIPQPTINPDIKKQLDKMAEKKKQLEEKNNMLNFLISAAEKGIIKLRRDVDSSSSFSDIKNEYEYQRGLINVSRGTKFLKQAIVIGSNGIELLARYFVDTLDIRLNGLSRTLDQQLSDNEDVLQEIWIKYIGTSDTALNSPEMRLAFIISSSMFSQHMANKMFKDKPHASIDSKDINMLYASNTHSS